MSDEQKNENPPNSQNNEQINLSPIPITDPAVIAKYWEKIEIENKERDRAGIKGPSDVGSKGKMDQIHFNKIPEAKIALRMLSDPRFKKLIKVDVLAFPVINCHDYVSKDLRWYEEHLYKKGEHEEYIPLVEKRTGYGDPWTDGMFPEEARFGAGRKGAVVLSETCAEVKCPECNGYGYRLKSRTVKDGSHSIKCPRCLGSGRENGRPCGRCGGDGWVRENDYTTEKDKVTCEKCLGSGRLRSVLEAHRVVGDYDSTDVFFMSIPKDTVPEVVRETLEWAGVWSNAADFKVVSKVESTDGRCALDEKNLPNVGQFKDALKKQLSEGRKKLDDKRAKFKSETLEFQSCVRIVRFHFKYYIGEMDWDVDGRMTDFAENAGLGKIDSRYFSRNRSHMIEMSIWLDTVTNRAWGSFPATPGYTANDPAQYCDPEIGLTALLVEMGKAANGGKKIALQKESKITTTSKSSKSSTAKKSVPQSQKKRWKFIALGLLFGWMGAHYLYAKRMFLLLLLWASFITGIAMIGSSQGDEKQQSQDATAEVAKKTSTNEAIGGGCIALWALLWLGGTFFVKKDGKGNRM